MQLNIKELKSSRFDLVKMITSDVFTIYLYEDNDNVQATIFLDRMKIDKMDLEGSVIDIKLKIAKGEGFDNL